MLGVGVIGVGSFGEKRAEAVLASSCGRLIGVADKDTMRYGRYPKEVGNPHGGWNFAITRRRIIFLPFWDYKNSRMEFYFGWRERGNFGIKLNFHHTPEKIKE